MKEKVDVTNRDGWPVAGDLVRTGRRRKESGSGEMGNKKGTKAESGETGNMNGAKMESMTGNNIIEIKDIRKQYGKGEAAVYALDGVDFSLEEGKVCVILGPSGSGKSTLLNMIGGLDSPDSGEITVDGRTITGMSKKELTKYRKQCIGFVFQFYNLIPDLTVEENVQVVAETITDKTYKNLMNNMLDAMGSMIYALMIIGVLICIAALYVTVNMMISESTHNISMLKVLGYNDRRINDMVINANHLLLIPGIVAGELFAYGLMAWYAKEFVNIEQLIIPATLEPKSAVITAAMVAAGYFISLGLLKHKVAKTDMIEALKDGRE